MPLAFTTSLPLDRATSCSSLAPVPVKIIDDSSLEAERRTPPPASPRGGITAASILEQVAPDSVPNDQAPVAVTTTSTVLVIAHDASNILHEQHTEEGESSANPEEAAVVEEPAGEHPAESAVVEEATQAPQVIEVGEEVNPEPVPEAVPVAEPLEAPAIVAPLPPQALPSRLKRLARVLEVTPPGVIDDAREGLRRLLGPNILTPGAPERAIEYLHVLRR